MLSSWVARKAAESLRHTFIRLSIVEGDLQKWAHFVETIIHPKKPMKTFNFVYRQMTRCVKTFLYTFLFKRAHGSWQTLLQKSFGKSHALERACAKTKRRTSTPRWRSLKPVVDLDRHPRHTFSASKAAEAYFRIIQLLLTTNQLSKGKSQ